MYETVRSRLQRQGDDLGVDDKHIYFYVLPDKLLKVTENISDRSAKIVVKGSRIGQGSASPKSSCLSRPPMYRPQSGCWTCSATSSTATTPSTADTTTATGASTWR